MSTALRTAATPGRERTIDLVAAATAVGVTFYIASWALAGIWQDGYDPARQAISELFAIGAPLPGRILLVVALVATGIGLVAFGWALDARIRGARAAGIAAAVSGIMTVGVAAFPCTAGCPGAGTSLNDTGHAITAGIGYTALVLAPLLLAATVWSRHRRLALVSLGLGGLAAFGLVARTLGLAPEYSGLQQRIFNTLADVWYVVAAVWLLRHSPRRDRQSALSPR